MSPLASTPAGVARVMTAYGVGTRWLRIRHVGWNGGLDADGQPRHLFEKRLHEEGIHFTTHGYIIFVRVPDDEDTPEPQTERLRRIAKAMNHGRMAACSRLKVGVRVIQITEDGPRFLPTVNKSGPVLRGPHLQHVGV